jgi:AGZA family xanthine/uracil permease-like MFS transporter
LTSLDALFDLKKHGSSARVESIGGLTTFLAMAYITVVNPSILSEAGMDFGAVFVATCIAAAFGSIVMGLYANYPIAQAPGMGQNAFFTFGVVLGMGHNWQTALGAVFVSGVIFVAMSVLPIREWLVNSIPRNLKLGMAAGIGLNTGWTGQDMELRTDRLHRRFRHYRSLVRPQGYRCSDHRYSIRHDNRVVVRQD